MKQLNYKQYPITYGVIGACVLIYIYTTINYGFQMSAYEGYLEGGFMPLAIYVDHEYLRFITANFIHFSLGHILMNMISLHNVGTFMESVYGKGRYILLLIGSALGTTFFPYLYYLFFTNKFEGMALTVSGGASGIILGLLGGLACLAWFYKGLFQNAFKSILPSLILITVISLTVPTVSLSGHLGGFIGGFLMTLMLIKHRPFYLWKFKNRQNPTDRPC